MKLDNKAEGSFSPYLLLGLVLIAIGAIGYTIFVALGIFIPLGVLLFLVGLSKGSEKEEKKERE